MALAMVTAARSSIQAGGGYRSDGVEIDLGTESDDVGEGESDASGRRARSSTTIWLMIGGG
jgi:hypothetical protein